MICLCTQHSYFLPWTFNLDKVLTIRKYSPLSPFSLSSQKRRWLLWEEGKMWIFWNLESYGCCLSLWGQNWALAVCLWRKKPWTFFHIPFVTECYISLFYCLPKLLFSPFSFLVMPIGPMELQHRFCKLKPSECLKLKQFHLQSNSHCSFDFYL